MLDAELEAWLTGLPPEIDHGRTVVVTSAGAPPQVATALHGTDGQGDEPSPETPDATGPAGGDVVGLRGWRAIPDGTEPQSSAEFSGRFEPDGDVIFGDGLRLRVRHYGMAPFVCIDGPTVLVIRDGADLSAFLRDADQAWSTGQFAEHATHPQTVIADLAALGGPCDDAGPARRIYVGDDGLVRTSPAGVALGAPAHGLAALTTRWQRLNGASAWPDACCLAGRIPDDDRIPALQERPWIRRYVTAVLAVRRVRRQDRIPCQVSGFGGRLVAGSGTAQEPSADPDDAPVLLRVGSGYRAVDPEGRAGTEIDLASLGAIEALLSGATDSDASGSARACRDLLGSGVAARWCRRQLGDDGAQTGERLPHTADAPTGAEGSVR